MKLDAPLDSCWGFNELPRLLSHIPEDISTWGHGPGGGYWWSDGRRFATLDVENWGTEQRAAIADWTIVTVRDVTKGTGDIPRPAPGYMVRLILGMYAR